MDGAGPLRFLKDILMPVSAANLAALFVILFVYGWNQYLWPLLVATNPRLDPIVIGIVQMIGVESTTDWAGVMATAVLARSAAGDRRGGDATLVRRRADRGRKVVATLELHGLRKSFGAVAGSARHRSGDARGRDAGDRRRLGLRQIDAAAAGRRAGAAERRAHPARRARRLRARPGGARHRHGIPELRALPAYERVRQHGLRAAHPRPVASRDPPPGGADGGSAGAGGAARAQAAPALGRAAPARRHGPRHRARAGAVPFRRAVIQSRRQAAGADAGRDSPPATPAGGDEPLRDPRSDRGDDARRSAAGSGSGADGAARDADGDFRPSRRSVRGRLHRRPGDEHAPGAAGGWRACGRGRGLAPGLCRRPTRRERTGASWWWESGPSICCPARGSTWRSI